MNLSIIIPAYNDAVDVLHCLNSLQATAADNATIQYIIQDDCSPDIDLRKIVPPYAAAVARNERNLGFSANCNAGAKRASGDILVFCNQDIEANQYSRGWDAPLRAAFADASVGIVGARLLFPNGHIQSAGGIYDAHLQPHHRCLGYSNIEHWEVNTPEAVSWVTGAFLAIRREVFEQVGGFDEAFISYWEDVDLCERVKAAGFKVWYEPRVTFTHKVGSTGGSPHFARGAALFKQRYVDTRRLRADVQAIYERWW